MASQKWTVAYRKEYSRARYLANKEQYNQSSRQYYQKNRKTANLRAMTWSSNNPVKVIASKKKFYNNNKEKCKQSVKNWKLNNPARVREMSRISSLKRRRTVKGNLDSRMGIMIRKALGRNKAGRKWLTLVDYTLEDLKQHLESKFTKGMTWELFLIGKIHIDHIKPKVLFKYLSSDDVEFKLCWALSNLQPLWALDNIRKHTKYEQS